jgi:hypothetical protein
VKAVKTDAIVLQDFPTTRAQAMALVEALSGINYDQHKAQPADKASPFAPLKPYVEERHDVTLCGLDRVIFIDSPIICDLDFDHALAPHTSSRRRPGMYPGGTRWQMALKLGAKLKLGHTASDKELHVHHHDWPKDVLSEILSARRDLDTDETVYLTRGWVHRNPKVSHVEEVHAPAFPAPTAGIALTLQVPCPCQRYPHTFLWSRDCLTDACPLLLSPSHPPPARGGRRHQDVFRPPERVAHVRDHLCGSHRLLLLG